VEVRPAGVLVLEAGQLAVEVRVEAGVQLDGERNPEYFSTFRDNLVIKLKEEVMASLFEKARIAALATAHKLMDKVVDLNSVEAVKQYVRDVENALEDLEDASATAAGHVRSVQRDAEQIRSQAKELNQNIDFILSDKKPENDHLATPLEARLIGLEQRLTTKDEEITTGQKTAQALSEAVSTLRTRYQNMVQQIQRLEAMDRATKAKESAVQAIKQAGQIASAGSDVSIDAVADRIQRRADVADARFERALGEMSGQVEKDVVIAQAQARLEARKARMALPSGEKTE
jgi:phage shock protein A